MKPKNFCILGLKLKEFLFLLLLFVRKNERILVQKTVNFPTFLRINLLEVKNRLKILFSIFPKKKENTKRKMLQDRELSFVCP